MADVVISASQVIAAGQGYTVPAAQEITVRAVRASFNGAAAAGSYVPTLQIVGDSGIITAECPVGTPVAAGASADVSWFPGVTAAAGTAGSGIAFDTHPQAGDWLYVETDNGGVAPNNFGIELNDQSNGIWEHSTGTFLAEGNSSVTLRSSAGNIGLTANAIGAHIDLAAQAQITLSAAQVNINLGLGLSRLNIVNLPTVNPGGSNRVWNNGGVLSIT